MAIFAIFFIIIFFPSISSASNSISLNQSLSGTQKLISENGDFELGFFKPGNSSYYYVGIWYSLKKVSQLTSVWIANRETPLSDSSKTFLKISENGNLVISNSSNPLIWSTNVTNIASNATVAILSNSGNLVLTDGLNSNKTLWESIDHPTHTWLPGGRLALDKVTNTTMKLTSWKSDDDPATGIFSLSIDPNGSSQYFIYWNNTFNYWSSGVWNGHIFSLVPEMTANYVYDFQYVTNARTNYFTYSLNTHIISRFIMDLSGQIKQLTWVETSNQWILFWSQPKKQCAVHALCGPYGSCNENELPYCNCIKGFRPKSLDNWLLSDYTQGCTRNKQLQCSSNSSAKSEKDKFLTMPNMRLPDNPVTLQGSSEVQCQETCLNNCSCNAYAYDDTNGCMRWYGDLIDLQDQYSGSGGGTMFLRLSALELPGSKSNKKTAIGAVAAGVGGILLILMLSWLFVIYIRRRRLQTKVVEGGLVAYRYSDLQRITKNFSDKLGQGAFGSVFKGTLNPNSIIAVKRLEGVGQGEKQFRTEVSTIGTIQHVNLVRLHGFCSEGTNRLLVYEYMPNSSLDSHLFDKKGCLLDWRTRYKIALGTARGLTYLHEQCRDCIVHCDIKPENILLDSSFVPKVADFGLAKLIGRDFSRVLTTMRGTRGYLAPEWITGVAITSKADVYSYGMMLFEIVSGMRNSDLRSDINDKGFFPSFAMSKLMEGDVMRLLDERLNGEGEEEEVERAVKVACWCIQDEEDMRPSMGQVVKILEGVVEVEMPNVPRTVKMLMDNPGNIMFYSESSETSSKTRSTSSHSSQGKSSSSASSKY